LLHFTAEDNTGEYVPFLEALAFLCSGDLEENISNLFHAFERGVVNGFRDPEEGGLLKVRKLDVLRLAAYLEAHR